MSEKPKCPDWLDMSKAWVSWPSEPFHGLSVLYCFVPGWVAPVGHIYVLMCAPNQDGKSLATIIDSYTYPLARRQGVRTRLNRSLFEDWDIDTIMSPSGTDEGGKAFMEASGYVYDSQIGAWYLTKETFKARQAARNLA